ncbi:tyrosine-type recombinase/integrase [Pseudonocardia sp. K10HN5]|uniref:Tyrosine-type recombinase/integrase n=1 Tax=Pseudonocardia acidicola TaxID=2724939 RepID=A0ABX1SB23_9PSEU|nr:tyrosine-type recombinase/integrase [Pseudonocardia acidicola]NMH97378.1 tyrosine-type recombinase/integrase [Pseudonocardia acidicola]
MAVIAGGERRVQHPRDLDQAVGGYAAASRAANTWRAYRGDVAHFERWCAAQAPPVAALPASPATLARYLADLAATHRPATLARRCSAIAAAHDLAGYPSPTRDQQVKTVLAGIRRRHGTRPARVAPARLDAVRAILATLDPDRLADVRDRALLLIGFAGALRRSELAALTVADLVEDHEGLRVFIVRSKTDPDAVGTTRGLAYGAHPASCPVRAWRSWLLHRGEAAAGRAAHPSAGPGSGSAATDPADPLLLPPRDLPGAAAFVAVDRHGRLGQRGLSDRAIARIIARRADAAGLPGHWAGHSLRRGFATTGYANGASELAIMRHGRWRSSSAMRGYIEEGSVWTDNPTARLGL